MLATTSLEGRQFGRYFLRHRLADGGMASVYLAQLEASFGLGKWVAVKVTHAHLAHQTRFARMFLDEARVTAQIQHPNVCSLVDFGEHEGTPFIVLEYLNGQSFTECLKRGFGTDGMPTWLAARVVADAARGLHAAHELTGPDGKSLGIVHRDISPQNLFVLYDGVCKVVDFGVAKARGRISESQTGELKGKFSYMAPEQLRGEGVDRRADVWSLAVVLWQTTTKRRLFDADDPATALTSILEAPAPAPSRYVPDYPKQLESTVLRALERDLAARTPTAAALADELEAHLFSLGHPTGPAQVAEWMQAHFAEERAERDKLLQASAQRSDRVDIHGTGQHSSVRRIGAEPADEQLVTQPRIDLPESQTAAWRKKRARWLAIGAVLAGVAAGAGLWVSASGGSEDDAAATRRPVIALEQEDIQVGNPPAPTPVPATDTAPGPSQVGGSSTHAAPDAAAARQKLPPRSSDRRPREGAGGGTKVATRATGLLSVIVRPTAADVYLRGRKIGRSPFNNLPLPVGRHILVLRRENGPPRQEPVEIRADTPTRVVVTF